MVAVRIGVLALQGAVQEHLHALRALDAHGVPVRWTRELEGLSGLIIPGGESTTIGDLMQHYGFFDAIREWGGPCYGTCAGAIILAERILDGKPDQPRLGLIPMTVRRNGFGRQVESAEAEVAMPVLGDEPVRTVFIRAPFFEEVGAGVEVLARYQEKIVAVRYGRHLATAFHPELSEDRRIHRLFVSMAAEAVKAAP